MWKISKPTLAKWRSLGRHYKLDPENPFVIRCNECDNLFLEEGHKYCVGCGTERLEMNGYNDSEEFTERINLKNLPDFVMRSHGPYNRCLNYWIEALIKVEHEKHSIGIRMHERHLSITIQQLRQWLKTKPEILMDVALAKLKHQKTFRLTKDEYNQYNLKNKHVHASDSLWWWMEGHR